MFTDKEIKDMLLADYLEIIARKRWNRKFPFLLDKKRIYQEIDKLQNKGL